jgi:hypothetical protein
MTANYRKNRHLYRFITLICTGTNHPVQMRDNICAERDTLYKCPTFVPGAASARCKCGFPLRRGRGAFVPGGGTTGTNEGFNCFYVSFL